MVGDDRRRSTDSVGNLDSLRGWAWLGSEVASLGGVMWFVGGANAWLR